VLQVLILWDRNDYYRRFNLPFVVSILFKTLQVLIASAPHSVLVCVCIYIYIFTLYFVGMTHNEVMGSMEHSQICWELKSQKHTERTAHCIGMYT
jgi:hypothetical protein